MGQSFLTQAKYRQQRQPVGLTYPLGSKYVGLSIGTATDVHVGTLDQICQHLQISLDEADLANNRGNGIFQRCFTAGRSPDINNTS
jgi:hypothetical protein